jgi:hypothetical protein
VGVAQMLDVRVEVGGGGAGGHFGDAIEGSGGR